jgi:hypothetical protein
MIGYPRLKGGVRPCPRGAAHSGPLDKVGWNLAGMPATTATGPPGKQSTPRQQHVQRVGYRDLLALQGGGEVGELADVDGGGELGGHDVALAAQPKDGVEPVGGRRRRIFGQQGDDEPGLEVAK